MPDKGAEQFLEDYPHQLRIRDGNHKRQIVKLLEVYGASLRIEVARLKALLNYDGQRYESWLEVGQALIDRTAEVARLQEQMQILAQNAADASNGSCQFALKLSEARAEVARLERERDEALEELRDARRDEI